MAANSYNHQPRLNRTFTGATRYHPSERERLELTAAHARPGQLRRTASRPRSHSRSGSGSRSRAQYSEWEYQQLLKENGSDGRSRLRFHPVAQILVSFALINVGLIGLIIVLQIKSVPIPQPFASLPMFGFGILVGIPILCVLIMVLQHRHLFYFETGEPTPLQTGAAAIEEEETEFEIEEDEPSLAAFEATVPLVPTAQIRGFVPPPPPPPSTSAAASPSLSDFGAEAHRRIAGRPRQHYSITYRGDNSESSPFEVLQNPARFEVQIQPGKRDTLDRQIARAVAARPEALCAEGSSASASSFLQANQSSQGQGQGRPNNEPGLNLDSTKEF